METEGPVIKIRGNVFHVRGQRVLPAADAAAFYRVSRAALMRAVRRNPDKFTREFMFRLTLREQGGIPALKNERRSTLVFTELGVAMLSTVLNSSKAAAVNVEIVRETIRLIKARSL